MGGGRASVLCGVGKNVLRFEMPDDEIYQNGIAILAAAT